MQDQIIQTEQTGQDHNKAAKEGKDRTMANRESTAYQECAGDVNSLDTTDETVLPTHGKNNNKKKSNKK